LRYPDRLNDIMLLPDAEFQDRFENQLIPYLCKTEAGFTPDTSPTKYLQWYGSTLGAQLGRFHKLGLCHRFLTLHNLTADCRLADFDTVQELPTDPREREQRLSNDRQKALETLTRYFSKFLPSYAYIQLFPVDLTDVSRAFEKAYREART
jgi:hypothetical protein